MKKKIIGVKGFNKDMTCRNMQYEEGKTYKIEGKPECCKFGYHFCENPIDCFSYYSPSNSVYHEVEAIGDISKDNDDTKISTNEIKIGARLDFQTMVKMAIDFTFKHCKKGGKAANKRTDYSVASNIGYCSMSNTIGENSVASNFGITGKAAGKKGNWLVLTEWEFNKNNKLEIKEVKSVKVDGKKIKENMYYSLENGEFVEKGMVEYD